MTAFAVAESVVELKPCPFCRSVAHLDYHSLEQTYSVTCGASKCQATIPYVGLTGTEAATAWNTRIEDDTPTVTGQGVQRPAVPSTGGFLSFWYKNYRGELSERTVIPIRIYHGATEWHPAPQWLLEAWDMEKDAVRAFAMSDMQAPPTPTGLLSELVEALERIAKGDPYTKLGAHQDNVHAILAKVKAGEGDRG